MHERVKKTLSLTKKCMFIKVNIKVHVRALVMRWAILRTLLLIDKINTTDTGSQLTCGIAKTQATALSVCPKFRTITIPFVFLIHTETDM